jgi:hypothetical protein
MTLKEKFIPLVWFNSGSFNVSQNREKDENSIKCEKIADDYATEFAEWVLNRALGESGLELKDDTLDKFKKEKGL